jgi:hypothetical protein
MSWKVIKSSNISRVEYSGDSMRVEFKRGEVYRYFGVPREKFEGLIKAESAGKYLHREIKGTYEYEREE